MVTRTRFDPAKHPRGPLGRFVDVPNGTRFQPREDLQALQTSALAGSSVSGYRVNKDEYGPDLFEDYLPPHASQSAIDNYIQSPMINTYLRGHMSAENLESVKGVDAAAEVMLLDEAIEHNGLADDVTLYRGVRPETWRGAALQPGDQIHDRGYLSTALDPGVARDFGGDLLEIEVPAGTGAALASDAESEILIGRGSVLEIQEVVPDQWRQNSGRERRIIRARLVGYIDESVD